MRQNLICYEVIISRPKMLNESFSIRLLQTIKRIKKFLNRCVILLDNAQNTPHFDSKLISVILLQFSRQNLLSNSFTDITHCLHQILLE